MASYRLQKLASVIKRVVGAELLNLSAETMFTITSVEVSPDLKGAKIWVSAQPPTPNDASLLKILHQYEPKLQATLARYLETKFTPKIEFKIDQSAKHLDKIEGLLKQIDKSPGAD